MLTWVSAAPRSASRSDREGHHGAAANTDCTWSCTRGALVPRFRQVQQKPGHLSGSVKTFAVSDN